MRDNRLSVGLKATLAIFAVTLFVTTTCAAGEKVLHSFNNELNNPHGGSNPSGRLIFDSAGNLYGTAYYGGVGGSCFDGDGRGCGTVFELTPKTGGGWTEKVLHNFTGKDGANPYPGLIFDSAGNLYGTTV